jgi:hypothetical protein
VGEQVGQCGASANSAPSDPGRWDRSWAGDSTVVRSSSDTDTPCSTIAVSTPRDGGTTTYVPARAGGLRCLPTVDGLPLDQLAVS